ncbi:unnamed protein product [Rhodiola kirilowii]
MLCPPRLLTSVLLGYDIGVMSGAIIFIQKDLKLTDVQIEILAGILSLYSLLGAFAAGRTSDYIGRRSIHHCHCRSLLLSRLYLHGSCTQLLTPHDRPLHCRTRRRIWYHGRFLLHRRALSTLMQRPPHLLLRSLHQRWYFTRLSLQLDLGWRLMLGIGVIPSLFIIFGILLMPESPRWLVLQGRLKDARKVLERASDSAEEAVSRLSDIKAAVGIAEDCNDDVVSVPKHHRDGTGVYKELLFKPTRPVRHIVIALIGLDWHGRCGYLQPQNIRKGRNHKQ